MKEKWPLKFVFLILVFLIVACSNELEKESTKENAEEVTEENATEEETEKVEGEPSIDLKRENYDQIIVGDYRTGEGGSTREEVIELLGYPDIVRGSEEAEGDSSSLADVEYTWNRLNGMRANISFKGSRVYQKSWFYSEEEIEEFVNNIVNNQ